MSHPRWQRGLRFRQPGWPTVLADAGYLVRSVGVSFKLPDGTTVTPDVLASSAARNTTLLVEVKGGSSFDHDQLGRMEKVGPIELRDAAYLPIRDVAMHQVAIVIVCNADQHEQFIEATVGRSATIVSFDGARFTFGGARMADADLQSARASVQIDPKAPPLNIVPFDHESDLGTVARIVVPEVVALLVNGVGAFNVDTILQRTHGVCHGVMQSTGSGAEYASIRKRVGDLMNEAAKGELASWLSKIPGQPMWSFNTAFPVDQATRTRERRRCRRTRWRSSNASVAARGFNWGFLTTSWEGNSARSAGRREQVGREPPPAPPRPPRPGRPAPLA